jgi:hypothetical protein
MVGRKSRRYGLSSSFVKLTQRLAENQFELARAVRFEAFGGRAGFGLYDHD